jgi:serine O-acetyltransferase
MAHSQWDLRAIVDGLRNSREVTHNVRPLGRIRELPSRETIGNVLDALAAALFPTHYGHSDLTDESIDFFVGETLSTALTLLTEQVRRGLLFADGNPGAEPLAARAVEIVRAFASQLPSLRALLVSDLQAAYKGDPAATSTSEILLCYPGIAAVMNYRFAHALHRLGAPLIPRLITEIAHSRTGIDIHPGAEIGPSFFIDHGTGVVIGETTIIGQHVRLYQAVTLGAKRFEVDADGALLKGGPRHPIVEDDVVIYAGATILGRVTIGRGSTIGGNVWLTRSVPPGSQITQAQSSNQPA